ncbi:hypothetical protein FA10DRAFT_200554 [Acaromyces ingoldii]|uniref:Uncharacterized protein n=1 Tax=Acaromyces ingoldii TaxID=215250 RepID=A0A316YB85_9BASI|nr:hypothetical protein FA10DRAFT_200554 [Acaromyces ingoldii]PWN86817.1 hypothetical protein FA10DRAFT_200554 [Acaromyces ingoldii]
MTSAHTALQYLRDMLQHNIDDRIWEEIVDDVNEKELKSPKTARLDLLSGKPPLEATCMRIALPTMVYSNRKRRRLNATMSLKDNADDKCNCGSCRRDSGSDASYSASGSSWGKGNSDGSASDGYGSNNSTGSLHQQLQGFGLTDGQNQSLSRSPQSVDNRASVTEHVRSAARLYGTWVWDEEQERSYLPDEEEGIGSGLQQTSPMAADGSELPSVASEDQVAAAQRTLADLTTKEKEVRDSQSSKSRPSTVCNICLRDDCGRQYLCKGDLSRQYILHRLAASPCGALWTRHDRLDRASQILAALGHQSPILCSLNKLRHPQIEAAASALVFLVSFGRAGYSDKELFQIIQDYTHPWEWDEARTMPDHLHTDDDGRLHSQRQASSTTESDKAEMMSYITLFSMSSDAHLELRRACLYIAQVVSSPAASAFRQDLPFHVPRHDYVNRRAVLRENMWAERGNSGLLLLQDFASCDSYDVPGLLSLQLYSFTLFADSGTSTSGSQYSKFAHQTRALRWTDILRLLLGLALDKASLTADDNVSHRRTVPFLIPICYGDLVWLDYVRHTFGRGHAIHWAQDSMCGTANDIFTAACTVAVFPSPGQFVYTSTVANLTELDSTALFGRLTSHCGQYTYRREQC